MDFIPIFLLIMLCYAAYLLFIIITAVITIVRGERRCKRIFSEAMLVIAEVVFTIIGPIIGFMRYDMYGSDIPFSKQHVLIVIVLVITSSASFWISRFAFKYNNLWFRILISAGMLQGIILCLICSIHFIPYIPLGMIYPWLGFELLSPVLAFVLLFRQFYFYNKIEFDIEQLLPYRKELGFIPLHYKIVQLPLLNRTIVYGMIMCGFVAAQVLLVYASGQEIDSLIKAFTHSHGFVFSMNSN